MNFPQTVEQLIHWDWSNGRDSFGVYHIITGFEGTGDCFWCGKELTSKQRRYCRGHWKDYWQHFNWSYARAWCFEQYDYTCANCGYKNIVPYRDHPSWYTQALEVHHIIPLEGIERAWSIYNVPWNLICLCHNCHQLIHAVMRVLNQPDPFDLAAARGQTIFELLR